MSKLCGTIRQREGQEMIYLKSIAQISAQEPLSDKWMTGNTVAQSGKEQIWRSIDADYAKFISPMESRRMGKMLKRAVATSMTCLNECGVEHPDAIITGTGLGCVQHSEAVLVDLCYNGDDAVKPTNFMQSTHNTISSLIGIRTHSHGYNCTYSQEGLSFENALADAMTQLRNGRISNALVNSFDEISDKYFIILQKAGYVGKDGECPASEAAVSAFLDTDEENAICRVNGVKLCWCQDADKQAEMLRRQLDSLMEEAGIRIEDIDFVLTGANGDIRHDRVYARLCKELLPDTPVARYKQLFGECLSASALGFYVAASCFKHNCIPEVLFQDGNSCNNGSSDGNSNDSCNGDSCNGNDNNSNSCNGDSCNGDSCNGNDNNGNSSNGDSCNGDSCNREWFNGKKPQNILLLNHFRGMDFSLTLLSKK